MAHEVPSTIFRFVTVRNPQKPDEDEIATGFIRYDGTLGSNVVEAYVKAARRKAAEAAKSFKDSKDFVEDPQEIDERLDGLVAWADWLAAESERLKRADFDAFNAAHGINVDRPVLKWLWNNLATHVLIGGRPEVREVLVGAIRALSLLGRPDLAQLSDADLRRCAAATVLMPARAREAAKPPEKKPDKPPAEDPERARREGELGRMRARIGVASGNSAARPGGRGNV
jgi:hypothetical protein